MARVGTELCPVQPSKARQHHAHLQQQDAPQPHTEIVFREGNDFGEGHNFSRATKAAKDRGSSPRSEFFSALSASRR